VIMRCAVINIATGIVDNVIEADPDIDKPEEGFSLFGSPPDFVQVGSEYKNGEFIDTRPLPEVNPMMTSKPPKSDPDVEFL